MPTCPIASYTDPYIVAEISCNHMGDEGIAHRLIDAASDARADAVKFQLFTPDDMALPGTMLTSGPWEGLEMRELYREAMTPRDWFPELFAHAGDVGLDPFASIFNPKDVGFLLDCGATAFKIASAEIGWTELIAAAADSLKPVIISTGMGSPSEIGAACQAAEPGPMVLLHCVSAYPTKVEDANLERMVDLELTYDVGAVGISDHSKGPVIPVAATALGAALIEKHLMLPNTRPLDQAFSLTPDEFGEMVVQVRQTFQALQRPKGDTEAESRQFKRRLIGERWLRG